MDRQITFQSSIFGGFNKKSVLKYIDELSASNQAAVDELSKKIAEIEENKSNLSMAVSSLNEQVISLRQEAEEQSDRALELQGTVENLRTEIERQQGLLAERDNEIQAHQERFRQLSQKAESLEAKSRKYDEAMCHIGGAFMEAQESAGHIIREAEERAGQMVTAAIESIKGLTEQISVFKGDVAALRYTLQSSMDDLEQRLDVIDSSIDALGEAIELVEMPELQAKSAESGLEEHKPETEDDPEAYLEPELGDEPDFEEPARRPMREAAPGPELDEKPAEFFW